MPNVSFHIDFFTQLSKVFFFCYWLFYMGINYLSLRNCLSPMWTFVWWNAFLRNYRQDNLLSGMKYQFKNNNNYCYFHIVKLLIKLVRSVDLTIIWQGFNDHCTYLQTVNERYLWLISQRVMWQLIYGDMTVLIFTVSSGIHRNKPSVG